MDIRILIDYNKLTLMVLKSHRLAARLVGYRNLSLSREVYGIKWCEEASDLDSREDFIDGASTSSLTHGEKEKLVFIFDGWNVTNV